MNFQTKRLFWTHFFPLYITFPMQQYEEVYYILHDYLTDGWCHATHIRNKGMWFTGQSPLIIYKLCRRDVFRTLAITDYNVCQGFGHIFFAVASIHFLFSPELWCNNTSFTKHRKCREPCGSYRERKSKLQEEFYHLSNVHALVLVKPVSHRYRSHWDALCTWTNSIICLGESAGGEQA